MRMEQLYYFVKTVQAQSFSKASEDLFLSQQALSASIKNLEREYNTRLLIRSPRGVTLSQEGEYFYEVASEILSLLEHLNEHFLSEQFVSEHPLRISLTSKSKNHFFPKVISYFYKNYPQCNITHHTTEPKEILPALLKGEADIGVLTLIKCDKKLLRELPADFTFIPFWCARCVLLTSIQSPLAHLHSVHMNTIVKYPIVLTASANFTEDVFYKLITQYTEDPDIIWTESYDLQESFVSDNIGNTLSIDSHILHSTSVNKIPIADNISINTGFLLRSDGVNHPFNKFYIEKARSIISGVQ